MSSYKDRKKEIEKLKSLIERMLSELDDLMTLNHVAIETYKLKNLYKEIQKEFWKL